MSDKPRMLRLPATTVMALVDACRMAEIDSRRTDRQLHDLTRDALCSALDAWNRHVDERMRTGGRS